MPTYWRVFFVDNILKPVDCTWSFDVYLYWLQFNIFSDVFVDYSQVFFATFEFAFSGWSNKTCVELKLLFVVLQKELRLRSLGNTECSSDVDLFSQHTFNSACYFNFYCDMFRFWIDTFISIVVTFLILYTKIKTFFYQCIDLILLLTL